MKIPVALTMLASPFSLPHNERWILPIALGFFTLLAVYFTRGGSKRKRATSGSFERK